MIFWFKPEALSLEKRLRSLANSLVACGHGVEVIRTRKPGIILYEDEYQVAAVPFRDTLL